jgi:ABC-type multidrug transport system ATPase subunit
MIQVDRLTKQFGKVKALDNVDLSIGHGELVAILGPNGSGKSTLFRSLLGIHDYAGSIKVEGFDPLRQGKQVRSNIGFMPQHSGLHADLTVQETLSFYTMVKGSSEVRALDLLEKMNLEHKLESKVSELSGGMRQRLAFVVAMLADPPVLLLDEPTASLDARSQEMILQWLTQLHKEGKTILISTHSKQDILSLAVRSITLEDGRVVDDRRYAESIVPMNMIRENEVGGARCYTH